MRSTSFTVSRRARLLALGVCISLMPATASAQVASALLREDDALLPGETISSLNNTAVNHVGGYACSLTTMGTSTASRIWGNATGGPGMLMRSESTIGRFTQTSFESFYGMSDTGQLAYGTTSTDNNSGATGLDGVWLDDLAVLHEEDPVPSLPGLWSTFNSRPTVSGNGMIHWVGGFSDTQGGSSQNRALFAGVGATSLLMGGDFLPGIAEPIDTTSSNIDFDFRVSRSGMLWIDLVLVDTSSATDGVMVINAVPIMAGGGMMRESLPVPAAVGGLPGELWDNFDFLGISDAGQYMVTGDTDAASDMDEFVLLDGMIILREGDVLDLGGNPAVLSGSIEGGYLNQDGDWAVIWDVDDVMGDNLEALIFNGEILLVEGDAVDWNGDGVIDPGDGDNFLDNFTGISALTVGARVGGIVNIYFTADIDFSGTNFEGFFCLPVEVGVPTIEVAVDIKPGSCPNSFNRNSNGVLPIALAGDMVFDPMQVDVSTILLTRADGGGGGIAPHEGPPGPHTVIADVTEPFFPAMPCECTENTPDGVADLSLKFDTDAVTEELGLDEFDPGALVELVVSGLMLDGTPFAGSDCVRLVPPGSSAGGLLVNSNLPDVWIDVTPMDSQLDGGGFTAFSRSYPQSTVVTIQVPTRPVNYARRILAGVWINGVQATLPATGGPTVTIQTEIADGTQSIALIYGWTGGPIVQHGGNAGRNIER